MLNSRRLETPLCRLGITLLLLLGCAFANGAERPKPTLDKKLYSGFGRGWVDIRETRLDLDYRVYTFDVFAGWNLHRNFALEGRIGAGSEDIQFNTSYALDSYLSLYTKPQYSAGPIKLYGLVGATLVNYEEERFVCDETCGDLKRDESAASVSYGIGARVSVRAFLVGIEYLQLLDKNNYRLDKAGFIFGIRF